LRISTLSGAVGGEARLQPNGDVTFSPQAGFHGIMRFRYTIADARGHAAVTLRSHDGNESVHMAAEVMLLTPDLPDDPALHRQWHLHEARVLPVWSDYTGRGVRIGMFEPSGSRPREKDIMDVHHPELRARLDPVWLAETGPDRQAGAGSDGQYSRHATQVAGVMVAARNGDGGIGVAHGATLGGHWLGDGDYASLSRMAEYDVVNHSWGPARPFGLPYFSAEVDRVASDYLAAIRDGRGGLGTTVVVSAGNDWSTGDNANYSGMVNSRAIIAVAALDPVDDLAILKTMNGGRFSSPGANVLVSAPGAGIVSAQRRLQLDNGSIAGAELATVRGTSFSAPIVSGTVALMLEANPHLGYRDIQDILALSARRTGRGDWQDNGSRSWNGGGMHVSHDYGFGSVDALAAVRLAETWTGQRTSHNEASMRRALASGTLAMAIPDALVAGVRHSLQVTGLDLRIETVAVRVALTHAHPGDLVLKLVAPSGTESILMDRPGRHRDKESHFGDSSFSGRNELDFVFSSMRHRGEDPNGTWTLEISDHASRDTGTLEHWSFNVFGAAGLADDHYVYTDEYAALASDPQRNRLSDTNGGHDTLNLAALSGPGQIDLRGNKATLAGKALGLVDGQQIEDVLGSGFDDRIFGSEAANLLRGGRGDDRLYGNDGADTLEGGPGNDRLVGGDGPDLFIIEPEANAKDEIWDLDPVSSGEADIVALVGFASRPVLVQDYAGSGVRLELGNGQEVWIADMSRHLLEGGRIVEFADRAQLQQWQQAMHAPMPDTDERTLNGRRGRINYRTGKVGDGVFSGEKGPDRFRVLANTDPRQGILLEASSFINVPNLIYDFEPEVDTIDLSQFVWLHGIGQLSIHVGYNDGGGWQLTRVLARQEGQSLLINLYDIAPEALSERNFIFAAPGSVAAPSSPPRVGAPPRLLERFAPAPALLPVMAGGEGADTLLGDAGGNRMVGGAGADRMAGGAGDDTYEVDDAGDQVIELAGEGHDLVRSRIDFTLPAEVEWLELTGDETISGTGNAGNNRLVGNGAANRLDGGAGSDTLLGGDGDDNYMVDDSADRVIELADQGRDTVFASCSFTLPSHVEYLLLTGQGPLDGSGNELDNHLTGNNQKNRLSGGAGDDRLYGQAGNDELRGGSGNDILHGGAGFDLFQFGRGDGRDVIADFDWDDDILRFGPDVGAEQLWFRRTDKGQVNIGVIGTA
ncbi:MAG: S8 family serine peptidase, partial [Microvirgula sp.]